jgi:predicted small metal-binding protein
MKTMTCEQLGGACDKEFQANTFDEVVQLSKQHGMAMYQAQDAAHLKLMAEVTELMKDPVAMQTWFENKKEEFTNLPED